MHANGYTEKEPVSDRTKRFFSDMQKAYEEAIRRKITGELAMAVKLNDGSPVSREIITRDTSR